MRRFVGGQAPSPDVVSASAATADPEPLRAACAACYAEQKRRKALPPLPGGICLLALDGHEGRSSRLRPWDGCQTRTVETAAGPCETYFPRYVAAQLIGDGWRWTVDAELQRPGEGELAAAERVFDRVRAAYPRAFDVVLGDALYASGPFWKKIRAADKDLVVVVKQEHRELVRDARGLWSAVPPPPPAPTGPRETARFYDVSGLRTWPQAADEVRLVRAEFEKTVRRQKDGVEVTTTSEWLWATSLPAGTFDAARIAALGRLRWCIENEGFNALVNRWNIDHLYRGGANAVTVFVLLTCLAQTVFDAFYRRDLKPALRARMTALAVADVVRGALRAYALPRADTS